jgi:PAS domain S-box-containing protein
MKLTGKLIVSFLLLSLIPTAAVGYLAFNHGRRTIERDTINHLTATTILKEAEFERWIAKSKREIERLAERGHVRAYAAILSVGAPDTSEYQAAYTDILEAHLRPALETERGFLELFVMRLNDGQIVASTDGIQEGKYREDERYFVEGQHDTYVQNVYYSLTREEAAMTIATPVMDNEGNPVAVLAGHVDLAEMTEIMRQGRAFRSTEETYLVNKFNFFVTESRFAPDYALKKAIHTAGVEACLAGSDGFGLYDDYRGLPIIGVYHWMPEHELCILTEVDQREAFAPIVALGNAVLGIGATVALIVSTLAVLFARSITGPVRQLARGAQEIGWGNLDYRIRVRTKDEIGQLAEAFNAMAAERKRAEATILEQARLLELVFRHSLDGIVLLDRHFNFVRVNDAYARAGRRDVSEFPGRNHFELYPSDAKAIFERVVETKEPYETIARPFVYPDHPEWGVTYWDWALVPILDDEGRVELLLFTLRDVTARARAEEELRQHRNHLEDLVRARTAELEQANQRLEREVAERTRIDEEIRLLQTIMLAVSEAQDYHSALEIALQKVCEATGWSYGEAWTLSPDGSVLEQGPVWACDTAGLERFKQLSSEYTFPPGIGLPGRIWSLQRPEWSQDVSSQPANVFLRAPMAIAAGLKAGFGVPIAVDDQVLAVLVFFMSESRQEDRRLVELVSTVAAQLGAVVQRRRAEDALRESEARYRLLFNSSHDAMFVSMLEGRGGTSRFVEVNDVACRRLGYSRDELLALSPADINTPEGKSMIPGKIKEILTGRPVLFETTHVARDGQEIPVEINSQLFELDGRPAILSAARDITDRKQAESQLRRYAERLEQMVSEKVRELEFERTKVIQTGKLAALGEMATGVAHELNQPLTSMLFDVDYLRALARRAQDAGSTEIALSVDELLKMGGNMAGDIDRCRRIIDHLRDFGRISDESVGVVDLNQPIQDSFILTEQRLKQHGVNLVLQLASDLPPILASAHKLEQVFLNLVSNAEHALAEVASRVQAGQVKRADYQKTLEISTYVEGDAVVARVRDNGCGIPLAAQERIFDPFFTTKPVGQGTGLGLSISYGIVNESGGEITFESEENRGTTFTLRFPAVR